MDLRWSPGGTEDAQSVPLIPSFMTAPLPHDGGAAAAKSAATPRGELVHPVENAFGANPFAPGSLSGRVLLLRRGKVTFDTKVRNVEAAGGGCVALLVVDSGDGASINVNIRNTAGTSAHVGPLVLCGVTKAAGEELIKLAGVGNVHASVHASGIMGEALASSSSSSSSSGGCSGPSQHKADDVGAPWTAHTADNRTPLRDVLGRTWLMAAAAMDNAGMLAAARAAAGLAGDDCAARWHKLVALQDHEGDTALHHAARNGASSPVIRLLLEGAAAASPAVATAAATAAPATTATAAAAAVTAAAAAAARNKEGYSPLGLAAEYGRVRFVETLLSEEFGADANDGVVTTYGDFGTVHPRALLPLHHAAAKGFGDVARALVRAGADTTAPNAKGDTAAAIATGTARALLADPLADALQELVRGHVDMGRARPAIEAALKADLGQDVEVVDVAANANEAIGASFVASAARMVQQGVDPMPRLLWHGCGPGVLGLLLKDGFKTSFSSLDFNVYGAGVYFAVDARLSTFFLTTNPKTGQPITPNPADGTYTLILAAVLLGRTGVRAPLLAGSESEKSSMELALKHPANRNPPVGCHSATGQKMKEVVLYENSCAFPAFTVRFRLPARAPPLPDPYDEDERTRYSYLRALPDAPRGILPGWRDARGAPAELDKGGEEGLAQLVRDAALIGGWDPAVALAEQEATNAMSERVQALVARNVELEREMGALRRTTTAALAVAVAVTAAATFVAWRGWRR
jgi:hypothetical protein